jgi:MFS family permease
MYAASVARPFSSPIWRNPAFVRVWTAATISIFGSLITRMALPFVAILVLGAGPIEVAGLRSVELVAGLGIGLVAGAWVDRLRRRPVLIWADLGRALLLFSIPLTFILGTLTLWQVFVVAASTAVLTAFFDAADNAYLPSIVERRELLDANSALTASGSTAEVTAFGISGVLIQVLTAPIAILIDAISFLVSAMLLGTIRRPEPPPPPPADRRPLVREIREGAGIVAGDPILRPLLLTQMSQGVMWGVTGAIYLLYAFEELSLGPAAIGLIAGAGGAGSLLGALLVGPAVRRWGVGPSAVGAMGLAAIGSSFIPLAPAGLPLAAAAFLVAQQVVGDAGVTAYDVTERSVTQALVDDRALGRASSTFTVGAGTAQLAGTIIAGLVAEAVGLRGAAVLAPLGALLGAVILWRSPVRSLRMDTLERTIGEAQPDVIGEHPIGG